LSSSLEKFVYYLAYTDFYFIRLSSHRSMTVMQTTCRVVKQLGVLTGRFQQLLRSTETHLITTVM